MARTGRRSRRSRRGGDRRQEALGVVVLLIALFLLLSLISYSPNDPPAYDSTGGPPGNWMGLLGARVAYGMVQELGRIPPLLTILVIFLWGWNLLRQTVSRRLVAVSLKIVAAQALLSIVLAFPHFMISREISYDLAGAVGGRFAGLLVTYTGLGAPLVWLALLVLFLMVAYNLKPGQIAGGVLSAVASVGTAIAALVKAVWTVLGRSARLFRSAGSALSERRSARAAKRAAAGSARAGLASPAEAGGGKGAATQGETPPPGAVPFERAAAGEPGAWEAAAAGEGPLPEPAPGPPGDELPPAPRPPRGSSEYAAPPLDLFALPSPEEMGTDEAILKREADLLQEKLHSFGVEVEVTGWQTGPVITRFEVKPAPGVKVNRIVNLADDLALAMRAKRIRIVAPIPGKAAVGVEIPNPEPRIVRLREILESEAYREASYRIPIALGRTINGEPFAADLGSMPHLLIAGTTGSGKSVCINGLIASLLYQMGPEQCRLILIDPKMLELGIYNKIPHLITPVVTDPRKAVEALKWTVLEMEERFDLLARFVTRDLDQFNAKVRTRREKAASDPEAAEDIPDPFPYIVVIIDELADLMMTASTEIETLIQRIAQKARAVGIHLILATQRPSVDVITGPIKANFSSRIAFQVPSKIDSRTILDVNGAEKLLGRGDMLYMTPAFTEPQRIHGTFLSNEEIERLVNFVGDQELESAARDIFGQVEIDTGRMGAAGEALDDLLREAAAVVTAHDQGSISLIQRRLGVGYTRAARMMDQLEMLGVVGPPDGTKAREVLLKEEDLDDLPWGGRR